MNQSLSVRRCFAVVPAAGSSSRMGRPKLTLPWRSSTIIEHVLAAWLSGGIDAVMVVVRRDDAELAAICARYPICVIAADPPPIDMAMSLGIGLAAIRSRFSPTDDDCWLTAPADIPGIAVPVISRLCDQWRTQTWEGAERAGAIAFVEGRRTHPVLFSWKIAREWLAEGIDQGRSTKTLRDWIDTSRPRPIDMDDLVARSELADIDDPEDYRRREG
jgi:molybdenum cofactor cytidylyltransferase